MRAPLPVEFVDQGDSILMRLEEWDQERTIHLADAVDPQTQRRTPLGYSVGRWEGNTLVIETTNNNAITWLDNNGDRHSDALIVVERFTPINNDAWAYEATFTDPVAYTASWKIAAPMTRGSDPKAEILEFACVEGNTDQLHYTEDVGGTTQAVPLDVPEEFLAPPANRGR